jgi:hypothetical protein
MSVSFKFNPTKFIDQLMSDGKRRSERQILKALVAVYTEQAGRDFKAWLRLRDTATDQGLRLEEAGPLSGRKDQWGMPLRYAYWRVEQDVDKIKPGDPLKRLPTREEALQMVKAEATAFEVAEKSRLAKRAGVIEE